MIVSVLANRGERNVNGDDNPVLRYKVNYGRL